MQIKESTYNILNNAVSYPAFIVDSELNILYKNNSAEKLFKSDNGNLVLGNNFYSLIQKGIDYLSRQKSESYDIEDYFLFENKNYQITVVNIEEDQNYLVYLRQVLSENKINPKQIKINFDEVGDFVKDQNLLEIFNFIEEYYPFTIISKAKLKKELNNYKLPFYIKDIREKFVVANEAYLNEKFKTNEHQILEFENYIKSNKKLIVVEGAYLEEKDLSLVKFPLLNFDNQLEAIVSLAYKIPDLEVSTFHQEILLKFPYPLMLINNENKLELVTEHFYNSKKDLKDISVNDFFSKETIKKIQLFWNSDLLEERNFIEIVPDYFEISEKVSFYKVGTEKKKYILLLFDSRLFNQSQIEANKNMYDVIMHTSPEAIFIYDIDNLRFLEVNAIALKMYGYTRDEFLQMDLTDLYAPEDIQTLIENAKFKSTTNGEFSGPWRHKTKNGKSVLVEMSKSTIDFKGKKAHFNIIKDVTPQLEREKEIQLFKATFESTSDPIVLTDKDGFITYVNKSVVNNLGYRYDDIIGKSILSLVTDGERASINSSIFHSNEKEGKRIKSKVKTYTNEEIPAEINAFPIVNYEGEIESFNLTINLKQEPKEAKKELKLVSENKIQSYDTSFLSNLFHELLTPINVIIGFAQELIESVDNPDKDQLEASQIIQENHKNLMLLMDSAAEYASLIADNFKLSKSDIRFVDLIHDIEDSVKKVSKDEKTELTYGKISSSLEFNTDRQRLLSFLNLILTIAIKITKNDKIFLSASKFDSDNAYISIRDEKNGITPHLLSGLEKIFTEDENELKRKYGVSRFGIRLVRRLLDVLNLGLDFDSSANDDFKIIVPFEFSSENFVKEKIDTIPIPKYEEVKKEKPIEIPKVEKVIEPAKTEIPQVEEKVLDLSQLECLYVEDQFESQTLFKVQMKDLKSISYATGLEDALPLIKSKKFDFIILDINLKGEYNGLDTLRFIRQIPGYQDVPIVAVTAYVLPGDKDNFIAAGFNDFISKPVLRDKILDSLNRVMA